MRLGGGQRLRRLARRVDRARGRRPGAPAARRSRASSASSADGQPLGLAGRAGLHRALVGERVGDAAQRLEPAGAAAGVVGGGPQCRPARRRRAGRPAASSARADASADAGGGRDALALGGVVEDAEQLGGARGRLELELERLVHRADVVERGAPGERGAAPLLQRVHPRGALGLGARRRRADGGGGLAPPHAACGAGAAVAARAARGPTRDVGASSGAGTPAACASRAASTASS